MQRIKLSILLGLFLLNFVSAYNGYGSFSFSDLLASIDQSMMILGTIFIVTFALLHFSLTKAFRGNKSIAGVIAFALASLITYGINKMDFNFEGFFYDIGISGDLLYILLPIIILVGIIWLANIKSKRTGKKFGFGNIFLILGALFIALGLTDLIYEKGAAMVIGLILMIIGIWAIFKKKRRINKKEQYSQQNYSKRFPHKRRERRISFSGPRKEWISRKEANERRAKEEAEIEKRRAEWEAKKQKKIQTKQKIWYDEYNKARRAGDLRRLSVAAKKLMNLGYDIRKQFENDYKSIWQVQKEEAEKKKKEKGRKRELRKEQRGRLRGIQEQREEQWKAQVQEAKQERERIKAEREKKKQEKEEKRRDREAQRLKELQQREAERESMKQEEETLKKQKIAERELRDQKIQERLEMRKQKKEQLRKIQEQREEQWKTKVQGAEKEREKKRRDRKAERLRQLQESQRIKQENEKRRKMFNYLQQLRQKKEMQLQKQQMMVAKGIKGAKQKVKTLQSDIEEITKRMKRFEVR